jgi:DNA-binding PadR family transcriptional regulator
MKQIKSRYFDIHESAMWPFRWMMHRKRGLRMAVVSMLSGSPKNGVELMNEMERMTQGWWRPSPGSVYPLLEQLTSEGMIRKRDDGRYELTEKANEEMEWSFGPSFRKQPSMDEMINEISGFVSFLEETSRTDRAKTAVYSQKMKDLAERLSSLAQQQSSDEKT